MSREPLARQPGVSWLGRTPAHRLDLVCQPAGAETLLYDPVADAIHVLNRTALAVWELCDGRHTPRDLGRQLRRRFAHTEAHDLVQEVISVLEVFEQEGLFAPFPGASQVPPAAHGGNES